MQVNIKRLHPDAVFPKYAKPGDAGMDLVATAITNTDEYIQYHTGLAMEIPDGYVGLLFPRSSNSKKDLLLANSVGVIDSSYRGEVCARFKVLTNKSRPKLSAQVYEVGDAVCQLMILPYPSIEFKAVEDLSETERGAGGFGSTGN